jgi:WD40 repeat protein
MDSGDIFVCKANLAGVFVQQRLHGHTERIHSLAWQPSRKPPYVRSHSLFDSHCFQVYAYQQPRQLAIFLEFQGQDYTSLASGSGDQTVRVWDVVSEISSTVLRVPDLDDKLPQSQKVKFWVPVGWVSQGQRLMSATSR